MPLMDAIPEILKIFYRGSANVQWCEHVVASHAYHDWISEWWNSWTNLAFVGVGAYGWNKAVLPSFQPLPRSFEFTELTMVGIGVGSFFFHAHQSKAAEYSDELPMSILALGYLWCLDGMHPLTRPPRRAKFYSMVILAVALVWGLYFYTRNFSIFEQGFAMQLLASLAVSYMAGTRLLPSNRKWWWTVFYLVAAKGLWDLERYRHKTQQCDVVGTLWLHPLWHLGSAVSHGYFMSFVADMHRAQALRATGDWPLQLMEEYNEDNKKDR